MKETDVEKERVSNNKEKRKQRTSSEERRTAPSKRNLSVQSSVLYATVRILQKNALSENNQPIERRTVMKKKGMHT
jgi:hypothetical protein